MLTYHSGPVVHSSTPYLIFWTPSGETLPSGGAALLEQQFTDIAAGSGESSNVFGVDRQYTDSGGFADYAQRFSSSSQAIVDTRGYPPLDKTNCKGTSEPTCLTDAQVESELQRLIDADGLPADGPRSASELASNAPIYFVVLPPDVNVCFGAGQPNVCSDSTFCAYHSSFTDSSRDQVLYAVIPTVLTTTPSNAKSCQTDGNSAVQEPNGTVADVVASYMSHEDNETITDPLGTGWWDPVSGNEEGDNCNFFGSFAPAKGTNPDAFAPALGGTPGGTLYDQLINGHAYYTQSEWSNGDGNCELRPSAGTISPSFTVPPANAIGASVNFDPAGSTSTNPISSETWDFGDGSTAFQIGSRTPGSHAYARAGAYDVTLTLVDDRGNVATTSEVVEVGYPTAVFTSSPGSPVERGQVSFDASASSDPDAGVAISSYSWDFGDGTTANGETISHDFRRYGTYTVTLTVSNRLGLSSSSSHQVTVADEPPSAVFTVATLHPAARVPVKFDATPSSDPDGTVSSYLWSFGDGATGSGATPTHTYAAAGAYPVTLTVTDSSGLMATSSERVVVVRGSRIRTISLLTRKHVRFLVIAVDGPGWLSIGRRIYALGKTRTANMRIRLTPPQYRALLDHRRLTLKVHVSFAPAVGAHQSRVVKLRLLFQVGRAP